MKRFKGVRGVAMLAVLLTLWLLPSQAHAAAPQVIGYVFAEDRVLQPESIAARRLTRINYAFANVADGRVVEGFTHDRENLVMLLGLKRQNPALRVLVSVGGWTWSKHFSDAALTPESRRAFADSAIDFVIRHGLDGLDVDWEYPGMEGDNNPFRLEDKQNYTALLRDLRLLFNRAQRRLHRPLLLTIATGASQSFLDHTNMREVSRFVDTINLMTYDMYGDDPNTGHHAPLFANAADPKHVSADGSVRAYLAAGVPRGKLVLGVPFYGKGWHKVPAQGNGLFQSGEPAHDLDLSYDIIATTLLQPGSGYTRYWDYTADNPYLYNAANGSWVDYEDPESIQHKTLYVLRQHLAGVMFWEYSGDANDALTTAIDEGLGLHVE